MKAPYLIGLVSLGLFFILIFLFFLFDLGRFVSLEYFKAHAQWLTGCANTHFITCSIVYLVTFIIIIAFSLPLTGPLTVLGGFLFGVLYGSTYAVFAATLGCAIAFLVMRSGIEQLKKRHMHRLQRFEKKIAQYGTSYLLVMHFSTIVPYAFINLLAAAVGISLLTVVWTTALGFIPIALVYTFAGSRLTHLTSMNDIFSFNVLLAFILLILFSLVPVIVKRLRGVKLP